MIPLIRWVRFNLVGALGMVVQLAALSLFNRLLHGRYLIASAAALELTVLHNFVWHTQYTWRDRRSGFSRRQQLLRFHLSNGLLSLAGNMALMRLLVHAVHLPVLTANAIAVLCCSAANFWFSHRWTFPAPRYSAPETQPSIRASIGCPLLTLPLIALLMCSKAHAQLPDASALHQQLTVPASANTSPPAVPHAHRNSVVAHYAFYESVFCGIVASTFEAGRYRLRCAELELTPNSALVPQSARLGSRSALTVCVKGITRIW